jgi:hypothetical protein
MDSKEPSEILPAEPTPDPHLSDRQLAQRRAAARHSTGPRTAQGKAASRYNAIKHGFFARDVVNPCLDGHHRVAEFSQLLRDLIDDFQPQGVFETLLVEEIAACCWRLRRALRTECRRAWLDEETDRSRNENNPPRFSLFGSAGLELQVKRQKVAETIVRAGLDSLLIPAYGDMMAIIRFERSIKRHLYRALAELLRLQSVRCKSSADHPPARTRPANQKLTKRTDR